jgi:hypothetical protein
VLTCWNCQEPGHVAANCLYARDLARPSVPGALAAARIEPDPPSPGYLQERQRLGMTSTGSGVLSVACPWCRVPRWRRCLNSATGCETDPHYARQEAAKTLQPSARLRDLALAQVAESRAARL